MAPSMISPANMLKLAFPGLTDIPTLMPAEVARLLDAMMARFMAKKESLQDFGDLKVLSFVDYEDYQLFLRLVQFVKGRAYVPFIPDSGRSAFSVVSESNIARPYDPNIHDLTWCSADETYASFTEEVRVLMFSIDSGLVDLQAYSARNIRSRYPIYTREVLHFIEAVRSRNITDFAAIDADLASFIRGRIDLLRKELCDDDTLATTLKMSAKSQLIALVQDMDDAAIEKLLDSCASDRQPSTEVLLDAFVKTQLTPKPKLPVSRTRHSVSVSATSAPEQSNGGLRSAQLTNDQITNHNNTIRRALFGVILHRHIVICASSGFGILRYRTDGSAIDFMNQDFRFGQGVILLINLDVRPLVAASGDLVVQNAQGHVGEIHGSVKVRAFQDALDGRFMPPPAMRASRGQSLGIVCEHGRGAGEESKGSPRILLPASQSRRVPDSSEQTEVHGLPSRSAKRSKREAGVSGDPEALSGDKVIDLTSTRACETEGLDESVVLLS